MSWPIGPDYNDAIQNPQANLRDPCLRRGKVVTTRLGLPAVDSGNFASVFQVLDGSQRWAVKCFTRQTRDQQERYRAISDQLKSRPLPFTVDFDYQPEGILVRGSWYPILRMQWIEGPLLDAYVRDNLTNQTALKQLAEKWVACVNALQQSGIAHGDLQFGNIKILGSEIRLIDYDGMYVPALIHKSSSETGHQNFQHPRRTGKDFGPYIDNFPAWVIYTSLHALAEQSSIWSDFEGGDDCLIFRKSDFECPESSPVFARLEYKASNELKALLVRLRNYARLPIQQVPPLGIARRSVNGLPQWITPSSVVEGVHQHSLPAEALQRTVRGKEVHRTKYIVLSTWILCVVGLAAGVAFPVSLFVLAGLVAACVAGAATLVLWQYKAFLGRMHARHLEKEISELTKQLDANDALLSSLEESDAAASEELRAVNAELAACIEGMTYDKQHLEDKRAAIHRAREMALHHAEREAHELLLKAEKEHRNQLTELNEQRAALEIQCHARLECLLQDLQKRFVESVLRSHPMKGMQFDGLGSDGATRLKNAGFETAYDVLLKNPRKVFGVGMREATALDAWAKDIRSKAESSAPQVVPKDYRSQVLTECAELRRGLAATISGLQQDWSRFVIVHGDTLANEQKKVQQRYWQEESNVAKEHFEVETQSKNAEHILRSKAAECERLRDGLVDRRGQLLQERNVLLGCRKERLMQSEVVRRLDFKTFVAVAIGVSSDYL
jgi:hypothetical protein